MPDMIRVRPAVAGTLVRNPNRAHRRLADVGEVVPASSFWLRRLAAGDVVDADAAEAAEKADAAKRAPSDPAPTSPAPGPTTTASSSDTSAKPTK